MKYRFEIQHEILRDPNTVAVLNFGGQHTGEIRDLVNGLGVKAVILPHDTPATMLTECGAIILSGGSNNVSDEDAPEYDPAIFEMGQPVYGICYGSQLIAQHFGGRVESGQESDLGSEFGKHKVRKAGDKTTGVLATASGDEAVWMNHNDRIVEIPKGFSVAAVTENGVVAGIVSDDEMIVGVQFHPEVAGTEFGRDLLAKFLFDKAKVKPTFEAQSLEARILEIQKTVGDRQVLAFLSGGVDSTVMVTLLAKALKPEQIVAVHIDNGLMRKGESDEVIIALRDLGVNVQKLDAEEYFLNSTTVIDGQQTRALKDEWMPEIKRKIIGDSFIRYQAEIAADLGLADGYLLAQGSIRPDLIESGSHGTVTIKTHHNDTPLARELRAAGRVIEPLSELYKPGVRALGRAFDLPESMIERQPFPGPGLGIRVLCQPVEALGEIEKQKLLEIYTTTAEILNGLGGVNHTILPVKSVGQKGDGRHYGHTVALSGEEDWPKLFGIAREISKQVKEVTRTVYVFGEALDLKIGQLTPTLLGHEVLKLLRDADAVVREELSAAELDKVLQQVPVILLPTGVDNGSERSVVLRPFITDNFMTGQVPEPGSEQMPLPVLRKIVDGILRIEGISRVMYDMTSKPPGTIEWE